jgi:hypothetical protein
MIMNDMKCHAYDCNANACVTPECYNNGIDNMVASTPPSTKKRRKTCPPREAMVARMGEHLTTPVRLGAPHISWFA